QRVSCCQTLIIGSEGKCECFPECRVVLFAMLLINQVFQYLLTNADITAITGIMEMRRIEMNRAEISRFSQNIIKILFGIMPQLFACKLSFRPSHIKRVLQQRAVFNN